MFQGRNSKAFTLIELIVVIVILGLLAALAVPTFSQVISNSKLGVDQASLAAQGRAQAAGAAFNAGLFDATAVLNTIEETNGWVGSSSGAPTKFGDLRYAISDTGDSLSFVTMSSDGKECLSTVVKGNSVSVSSKAFDAATCLTGVIDTPVDPEMPPGPQAPLILNINTALTGCTAGTTGFTLPLGDGASGVVSWGDESEDSTWVPALTHVYQTPGVYQVSFTGTSPSYGSKSMPSQGANRCIDTVERFDSSEMGATDLSYAFYKATSLATLPADMDTSGVTDMRYMFYQAPNFNSDLTSWDTSLVQSTNFMFAQAFAFNGDVSNWVTSNMEVTSDMFSRATAFNQDLSDWDTQKLISSSAMFSGATSFNGDISSWDVKKLTTTANMFSGATAFNSDLSSWETIALTNMNSMFRNASTFNQDLSGWNVSEVTTSSNYDTGATSWQADFKPRFN